MQDLNILQQKIQELEKDVLSMQSWILEKTKQQISFPIDETSFKIIADRTYPVNSIFISIDNTNPALSLGYGSWTPVGVGEAISGINTGTGGGTVTTSFQSGSGILLSFYQAYFWLRTS